MKIFNDLDEIYRDGIEPVPVDDIWVYRCTVCGKDYKRRKSADKHLARMDCHQMQNIFKGTETEWLLYEIFKNLMAVIDCPVSGITRFRRNRYYKPIARFYVFCFQNSVADPLAFLQFALENTEWKTLLQGVANAAKESLLRDYRKRMRITTSDTQSEDFYRANSNLLGVDTTFTIRALERGEIRADYLFEHIDIDDYCRRLTPAEEYRLDKFLETIE